MVTVAGISGTFLIWLHAPDTCLTGKAFLRSDKPKADHRSLAGSEWYAWNPFDQQNKTTRQITERKKVNNFFWESIPTTDLLSREGIRSLESPDLRDFLVLRGTQRNRNLEQNILILNWDGYKMYATYSPNFCPGTKGWISWHQRDFEEEYNWCSYPPLPHPQQGLFRRQNTVAKY